MVTQPQGHLGDHQWRNTHGETPRGTNLGNNPWRNTPGRQVGDNPWGTHIVFEQTGDTGGRHSDVPLGETSGNPTGRHQLGEPYFGTSPGDNLGDQPGCPQKRIISRET